jgi:mRNA interferase RelE/StbE
LAFTVEIKRKALRFIEELDEKRKHRIAEIILILKDDPIPFKKEDVVKLKGYDSTYRIRIGESRLVYTVSWDERKILIHYAGPRGGAYE